MKIFTVVFASFSLRLPNFAGCCDDLQTLLLKFLESRNKISERFYFILSAESKYYLFC